MPLTTFATKTGPVPEVLFIIKSVIATFAAFPVPDAPTAPAPVKVNVDALIVAFPDIGPELLIVRFPAVMAFVPRESVAVFSVNVLVLALSGAESVTFPAVIAPPGTLVPFSVSGFPPLVTNVVP
jgi:hypothetical protein